MGVKDNNKYLIKNKAWDWLQYGRSFSVAAQLCCERLLSGQEVPGFDLKYLPISTIYNIKHALEVYLKMIQLLLGQNILKGPDGHNLHEIFIQIEEGVKIIDKKVYNYLLNKRDVSKQLEIGNKNLDIWRKGWAKIAVAVETYYHLTFLDNKGFNPNDLQDLKNVIFKYPDAQLWQSNKLNTVLEKITIEDVKIFKKEISEVSDLITELLIILLFFNFETKGEPI